MAQIFLSVEHIFGNYYFTIRILGNELAYLLAIRSIDSCGNGACEQTAIKCDSPLRGIKTNDVDWCVFRELIGYKTGCESNAKIVILGIINSFLNNSDCYPFSLFLPGQGRLVGEHLGCQLELIDQCGGLECPYAIGWLSYRQLHSEIISPGNMS